MEEKIIRSWMRLWFPRFSIRFNGAGVPADTCALTGDLEMILELSLSMSMNMSTNMSLT